MDVRSLGSIDEARSKRRQMAVVEPVTVRENRERVERAIEEDRRLIEETRAQRARQRELALRAKRGVRLAREALRRASG
jgi:hypothetical protein